MFGGVITADEAFQGVRAGPIVVIVFADASTHLAPTPTWSQGNGVHRTCRDRRRFMRHAS
jgi:hypothetical protein